MRKPLLATAASLVLTKRRCCCRGVWQALLRPPAMPAPRASGMAPVNDILRRVIARS
jgi:hypothetical protein